MNFDLSPDQKMLVDTATSYAKKQSPVHRARKLRDDATGWEPAAWRKMADLGWLGLPFPEAAGGIGGSTLDVALLCEALGTTLVPEPFLPSVVLGGGALALAGSPEQHAQWLAPMIEGRTSLALAHTERAGRFDPAYCATRAERTGGRWRLRGTKDEVLNGHAADQLVVVARTDGAAGDRAGLALFVVPRDAHGVTVTPHHTLDGRRAAQITLDVEVGDDARLGDEAADTIETVLDRAAAATVAEGVGVTATALAMTVEYLGTREQFGVKIGSFQALQHRAVDMFVEVETLRSLNILAALRADAPDVHVRREAVSAAKVQLASGGRFVVRQAIQLFGGIGITDEHDIGLYFKRLQMLSTLFGDEVHHLRRYGELPSFAGNL